MKTERANVAGRVGLHELIESAPLSDGGRVYRPPGGAR